MKRIILSRKGFDSEAGGGASPILDDGRFFSIPIPQNHPSQKKYEDLNFDGISGTELLKEASAKVLPTDYCHHDPLLNESIGIFGQVNQSQTELKKNHVGIGDLFLFFGWFNNFSRKRRDLHKIFGWLQIEEIIEGSDKIIKYLKEKNISHPHGYGDTSKFPNNTIYIGKKSLEIKGKKISKRGHGLFKKTHDDLILTDLTQKYRSRWKFPKKYFANSNNLFLNRMKWENKKESTTCYRGFGQEFILDVEKNPKVIDWAENLILKHG